VPEEPEASVEVEVARVAEEVEDGLAEVEGVVQEAEDKA